MKRFELVSDTYRQHPNTEIQLPKRATAKACAYDFYSPESFTLAPGEIRCVWTDVRANIPDNYYLEINVRSSMGKSLIRLANTLGYVDADYYNNKQTGGNIGIMLHNAGSEPWTVNTGDRIAQGKLDTYEVMDDDEATGERNGGFGSTNASQYSAKTRTAPTDERVDKYNKMLEKMGINLNGPDDDLINAFCQMFGA